MAQETFSIIDVVNYIYERRAGTAAEAWNKGQIASYVFGNIANRSILVASEGKQIFSVVVFDPDFKQGFFVDQLWAESKAGVAMLLRQLEKDYPTVKTLLGWRTNHLVEFKLATLKKIFYGK